MYTFRNDIVRAVRHLVTPSISYGYSPDFSSQTMKNYVNDKGTSVAYSPYFKSAFPVYASKESSMMTLSVNSNLEMKVRDQKDTVTGTKKIPLVKSLTVSCKYDFNDSIPWSDINIAASNTFFNRIDVRFSANLDPYAMEQDPKTKLPRRSEGLMYDQTGQLWRTENSSWDLNTSINLGPVKKETGTQKPKTDAKTKKYPGYEDFSLPWSFSLSYNLRMPKQYYWDENSQLDSVSTKMIQTISGNGKFSVTNNWMVTYGLGLDVEKMMFNQPRLGIYRDLHCWEMNLTWIPFGPMQRYEFKINVKASVFQDLKYEKDDRKRPVY